MKRGFTLIEVIIAIALTAMLIVAISGLGGMSIKMNLQGNKMDEGFNIARSICEMYMSNKDTYSSNGYETKVYKYINSLSDIQDMNDLINNSNGVYNESNFKEIIDSSKDFKYTLIIQIRRISDAENMEGIWLDVIKNDSELGKVSLNASKCEN